MTTFLTAVLCTMLFMSAFAGNCFAENADDNEILDQLRLIPASTLADAVDKAIGKPGFMKHDMRPMGNPQRMAGRAKTVQLAPVTSVATLGARHSIETIDSSGPGDVIVIKGTSLDIACIGGLMAHAVKIRKIEGVVIDGAARDITELKELGVKVYARSITTATGVGRQTSLNREIPVVCGGVTVTPGDYIVADYDGVVRIPAEHIEEVLKIALEMEAKEKEMVPKLKEIKSLKKVIDMFKRI